MGGAMAETFDPYHKWLSIPPEDQPPDLYCLLGLPRFESDPDVIAAAADRQMSHLRSYQAGSHGRESQRLLNEVAAARICLLSAEKKAAYDQQLREKLGPPPEAPPPPPPRVPPARRAAAPPRAGQQTALIEQLGEYKLLEKLGAGGMGTVYKAVHTEMDRIVAVKVLPHGLLADERAVARFKREIKAVAQLKHPNVVEAYDAREIEGTRFLVMEYVEGIDVSALIKRDAALPVADACEIVRQAALGLQSAHEQGLVHRDVKPSNLMLTPEGRVKLLDLGLARPGAQEEEEVTGTGEAMGTLDYMAPEQIMDSRGVDIRGDVYSLGCTLYMLLAGRAPFSGPKYNTGGKKLMAHVQDRPEPIAALRAEVPPALALVVERMMAKGPEDRFATPGEVAAALKPFAAEARLRTLATSKPRPKPDGPQAMVATIGSQSSGFAQFLNTMRIRRPRAPEAEAGQEAKPPPLGIYAAVAGSALLILVAIGLILAGRGGQGDGKKPKEKSAAAVATTQKTKGADREPKETEKPASPSVQHVVLEWPVADRANAILQIDDRDQNLASLRSDPLRLPVAPGKHTVWIMRRGYEPLEASVTVPAGRDVAVPLEWKKASTVALVPDAKPDLKPEEKPKPPEKPKPEPKAKPEPKPDPPQPKIDPVLAAREAKWRNAMQPVDELLAKWDFAGAQAALEKIRLEEPDLQERLARRADELERMAALKTKMIARIKAARPPLKKTDLMLRGMNGEVKGADDQAIHALLASGKTEEHPWAELNDKARPKLLELVVDPSSAEDWLGAGLMAFAAGDVPLAEKLLDKARSLGTDIGPYLGSLAGAAFARVESVLEEEKWAAAEKALAQLEEKYGSTEWFSKNRPLFDAAMAKAKSGIYEAEAEKLYAEAAKLFEEEELFDVRDLVEKLKSDYPESRAVCDADRQSPLEEMEKATATLGKRLIVRQDGKGDFTTIRDAMKAAEPEDLVEVRDSGTYQGPIEFLVGNLTVRGRKGCWPVLTSAGIADGVQNLIEVKTQGTSLERLILIHASPKAPDPAAIRGYHDTTLKMRRCIVYAPTGRAVYWQARDNSGAASGATVFDACIFANEVSVRNGPLARHCIALRHFRVHDGTIRLEHCIAAGTSVGHGALELRYCTVFRDAAASRGVVRDSIVGEIKGGADLLADRCDILKTVTGGAKAANTCFSADPQFANPKMLDYRLAETSPCKGKASDGGDIGCRYTPEMIEMCKIALELRAKGIIKF